MKSYRYELAGWLLALVVPLAGCSGGSSADPVGSPPAIAPDAAERSAARRNAALSRAAEYLVSAQSADGAWRSEVYGSFKTGDSLTPLAIVALMEVDDRDRVHVAIERGIGYLLKLRSEGTRDSPQVEITYPVYTAAGAVSVFARRSDPHSRGELDGWLTDLREQQLTESLGWQADDLYYGGWSYAKALPRKPDAGQPLGPLAQPNLSATVFALDALGRAGVGNADLAVSKALSFIVRCQNFSDDGTGLDPRYDDGGFYFIQDDDVRNKAGQAGVDDVGRGRFASYGSATADGLRGLLLCGLPSDHPRVRAARGWLETHFSAVSHPGAYRSDREGARNALYYYYCRSLAEALAADRESPLALAYGRWRRELVDALIERQHPNGSWLNAAVDVRENDPLVATPLAMMAIASSRANINP
jgi:squalene-hopene/tetraprenyl-beta-curcumene cyclase